MPMTQRGHATTTPIDARLLAAADTSRFEARPGPFCGEPLYVREFWNLAIAGLADQDLMCGDSRTLVSCFELDESHWVQHPGLTGVPVIAVWEDQDGQVHSRAMTVSDYALFVAAGNASDLAE